MKFEKGLLLIFSGALVLLSGCVAKDVVFNEQQKRMQRCEQYVDREREACLQGDFVSIQDYKDEYDAFQRSNEKQKEKEKIKVTIPVAPKPVDPVNKKP